MRHSVNGNHTIFLCTVWNRLNLRVPAISPGFSDASSLTIVRDADDNPKGAFQNVQDALKYAAFLTDIVANYMKTRYEFEAPVKRNVKRDKDGR